LTGPASPDGKEPSDILLQVSHLNKRFTKGHGTIRRRIEVVKAVDDVSFEVRKSEVLSIVGESGSGKTTIAKCLMALTRPTSGSILYNGADLAHLKGKALTDYWRDVQIAFQDPFESLIPRQDAYTTISLSMRRLTGLNDKSKLTEKSAQLLFEVGLDPEKVMHKLPHQLSGGERQRVNFARALASDPKILIADEPVTMVDASQRMTILSLLAQLKSERNLTIVLITHDLASAKLLSDRTAIMYSGKLVEIGPTEIILSQPFHPYSELILIATPRLGAKVQSFEEFGVGIEASEGIEQGCIFRPRCKYAIDVCKDAEPPLLEKVKGHYVACHVRNQA